MSGNLQIVLRVCVLAISGASAAFNPSLTRSANAVAFSPNDKGSAPETTVDSIVAKLVERNRQRESRMQEVSYAGSRIYRIKDDKGNLRTEAQVQMSYRAPGAKEFKILSQTGSNFIFGRVIKPLMEHEADAAAGRNRADAAITPTNYSFEFLGEEQISGLRCYVLKTTPKRSDKFLFRGKIWVHATEFAVVKIEGQPAKNLSMMVKRVDFVRRYNKVGEFWLPLKDESISQVRFAGTNYLSIEYQGYDLPGNRSLAHK